MDDYGIDLDEVGRVIDSADVLVVRFAIVDKRLLIDARTTETEGPAIAVVDKATSVEDRFKTRRRCGRASRCRSGSCPSCGHATSIHSCIGPRRAGSGAAWSVWVATEWLERCNAAFDELSRQERTETFMAIRGGETYQTLWQRAG